MEQKLIIVKEINAGWCEVCHQSVCVVCSESYIQRMLKLFPGGVALKHSRSMRSWETFESYSLIQGACQVAQWGKLTFSFLGFLGLFLIPGVIRMLILGSLDAALIAFVIFVGYVLFTSLLYCIFLQKADCFD